MKYTALIFDTVNHDEQAYEYMKKACEILKEDDNCKQIVISCKADWILKLSQNPIPKAMFVQTSSKPYVALLNGLKAVSQENVVVIGLSKEMSQTNIDELMSALAKYPSVAYKDHSFEAFDTRLLMFCLQFAIETNLAVDSYSKAVEALADTPIQYI